MSISENKAIRYEDLEKVGYSIKKAANNLKSACSTLSKIFNTDKSFVKAIFPLATRMVRVVQDIMECYEVLSFDEFREEIGEYQAVDQLTDIKMTGLNTLEDELNRMIKNGEKRRSHYVKCKKTAAVIISSCRDYISIIPTCEGDLLSIRYDNIHENYFEEWLSKNNFKNPKSYLR
ncbi:hypothetical protein C2G38_2191395 [Gigaspora rosea]|uniref:Uncharacterized protein n=1 Tax=Gigaspora rosea TaxID=44941 RepID=A0A397V1S0_9GLOM|nr:hypothetical protein C2G38_2191395 [Gigaspora rosea]